MKRVSFVGLGLIGKERLGAIKILQRRGRAISAANVFDPYSGDVAELALAADAEICSSLEGIAAARPDLAVVAVPHDSALQIVSYLLGQGVRVLLEKPMGRNLDEARAIASHRRHDDQLFVGQNCRFFAGVAALIEDVRTGRFGTPVGLTMLLGHGGSPQDGLGWKLDPVRAGGGCLIDPGIHLLDLAVLLEGGKPAVRGGGSWKGFWNTGIEEDCRVVLAGNFIPLIDIHISVVRWRSTFRIEFFGTEGYGIVEGRGRSYGPQTYRRGKRWGWKAGVSQSASEELLLTDGGEHVFADELETLLFKGPESRPFVATVADSILNMELLEECRSNMGLGTLDIAEVFEPTEPGDVT